MVLRIRKVNILQWALVSGIIYAIFGLIMGIVWIPFAALLAAMPTRGAAFPGAGLGIAAVIIFPIMYFIGGFIGGVIIAALFNLASGWLGGVEMTVDTAVPAPLPSV